jgi:hypothetical protein
MEGGVTNIELQGFRFWKEKSVEDVVTLGPRAQAILVYTKEKNWLVLYDHVKVLKTTCVKSQASFMCPWWAVWFFMKPTVSQFPSTSPLSVTQEIKFCLGFGTLQSPQPQALLESDLLALRLCRVCHYCGKACNLMLYLALNNKLQKTNGGKVLSSNPVECR